MFRCPLPSTGSAHCVPPLLRYYKALRLPDDLPAWLRCLRQLSTTATRLSLPRRSGAHPPRTRVVHRLPQPATRHGVVRASQVPGQQPCVRAPLSDPGESPGPSQYGPGLLPSAIRTASALATLQFFRGSITRPTHLLSTLRSPGCPGTTQDLLPAGGLLYRTGFEPAGFLREVSALYITSSSPRLYLAHTNRLTPFLPGGLPSAALLGPSAPALPLNTAPIPPIRNCSPDPVVTRGTEP